MAIARWIPRKSFDEAMLKAEKLKKVAEAKERRNSALFTEAQENLRRELSLHPRQEVPAKQIHACRCGSDTAIRMRPSRSLIRVRIKRK